MPKIFISYRRADSRKDAGRIYDRLVEAFGKTNIFKDVDNIPFGRDFRGVLSEAVNQCDVMLVIIGQHWLDITDEAGNRRLDNPADFVRIEVQTGLQRGDVRCLVIPVLVDSAAMPAANLLPRELQELAFKNAVTVRDDPDFHNDMGRLVRQLKQHNSKPRPTSPTPFSMVRVMLSPAGIVALMLIIALGMFLLSRLIQNASNLPTPTTAALLSSNTPQATKAVSVVILSPTMEVIAQPTNTVAPTASATPAEAPSKTPTSTLTNTATSTASFTPKPSATATSTPSNTPTPSATFTPTLVPTNTALPVILHNADWKPVVQPINGVMMVEVPAGCFDMGSPEGWTEEQPITKICFDKSFWMDKTEVTNAQFAQFGGKAANLSNWTDANRPRETISWFDARNFCELRGARLPTESEWEYAARGPDNLIYPWGNEFNAANAVYYDNSNSQTAAVGSKPSGASWVGALDLSGNVWEWVSTLYKPYPYPVAGSADERDNWITGGNTTDSRTLRGGSWNSFSDFLRAAARSEFSLSFTLSSLGFRCVVSAPSS